MSGLVLDFPETLLPDREPQLLTRHRRYSSRIIADISVYTSDVFNHATANIELEHNHADVDFIHNQISFGHVSLNFMDYGCSSGSVRVKTPPMNRCYVVQLSLSGSAEFCQDGKVLPVPCGAMLIIPPDRPVDLRLHSDYQGMVLRVDRPTLEAALAEQLGRRLSAPIIFDHTIIPADGVGNALAAMLISLCVNADSNFPICTQGPLGGSIQDTLCSLLLWSLPHNYTRELGEEIGPAPYYVRRVETFIKSHAKEPIGFDDLVDAARVSRRTIHEGFRRYRNTTPMAYLKDYRLKLARTALQSGPGNTVTDIALDCGFNHLSKFSLEYHQRFGERPSETLSRRARLRH